MSIFRLPDLGEGLQEAEIIEWKVAVGDSVCADETLASIETDKAVVDVPSPQAGVIRTLHAKVGETVCVGAALVTFEASEASVPIKTATPSPTLAEDQADHEDKAIRDTGVVVGAMTQTDNVQREQAARIAGESGLKAAPAVRALARRLNVDLTIITPTGPDGLITAADVQRVHKILSEVGPIEKLKGPRKAMANSMSQSRDEIMPTTLMDDARLHAWPGKQDVSCRLIRAITAGVKEEPALNAWFDHVEVGRRLLDKIHLGIAVDTPDGLFVCVLQDVAARDPKSLRLGLDKMKADARERRIPLEELRGYTLTLSNFGRFGGRYATPVIIPPTVAIVAAGGVRDDVVVIDGRSAVSAVLPVSLTFDHRAVTGAEAGRFLAALINDLEKGE
tara:strand:- start:3257 stop:4429 length:1173 start_codon:yes stop_codon:yes gene_type:complete